MKKLKMARGVTLTFEEGCNKYLENCRQRNLREGTINHYRQSYLYFYKFFDPKMPIEDIDEQLYAYCNVSTQQQQLADRIGVTKSVISYYELQERYPSPEVLTKLASIFHVTTDSLLGIERGGCSIDLSGLDDEDIITIKRLVTSLREKNLKK